MKKLFILPVMALALAGAFTSCSDSDSDNDGGISGSKPIDPSKVKLNAVYDVNGTDYVLTRCGSERYYYTANGLPTRVNNSVISYSTGQVLTGSSYETINFYLNDKGFLSKYAYENDDPEEYEKGEATFSYDGSGHLTKVSVKTSGYDMEDGEKIKWNSSGSMNYTWKDGGVVKASGSESGTDDGSKYSVKYNITVTNTSNNNPLGLCTQSFIDALYMEIEGFEMLGFLGKAPVSLPATITIVETYSEDGETETDTLNYTYSQSFSSDGLLNSERYSHDSYYTSTISYTYTPLSSITPEAASAPSRASQEGNSHSLRHFLKSSFKK